MHLRSEEKTDVNNECILKQANSASISLLDGVLTRRENLLLPLFTSQL